MNGVGKVPASVMNHPRIAAMVVAFCGMLLAVACTTSAAPSATPATGTEPTPIQVVPGVEVATQSADLTPSVIPQVTPINVDDRGILFHHAFGFLVPDPVVDSQVNDFLFGEVFSGLVRLGDGLEGEIEPDLASSFSVSDDGLRYRFELREGSRFSDGNPLTADDVKWSWERALLPETGARRAGAVLGDITGATALMAGETGELTGVTVVDDSTLEVTLERRQPNFPAFLADPLASVLSADNVASWGTVNWSEFMREGWVEQHPTLTFNELPVGTGPFRIVELDWQTEATLEPNPFYWGGEPQIDSLIIRDLFGSGLDGRAESESLWGFDVYHADSETIEGVREGFPGTLDGVSFGIFEAAIFETAPQISFLALNSAIAPYDDVDFRRALYHSAFREPSVVVSMQGIPDQSASGLLPPKFPGHVATLAWDGPDRELASLAFERSRYGQEGYHESITFVSDASTPYPFWFDEVSQNWSEWLGLDSDAADPETILPLDRFESEYAAGILQMRYVHVKPRYPDPHAILGMIPTLFGPNAESDETRKLAAMLDDAAVETDRAARIAKYQAIERHILDRALVIPVFWDDGTIYELVKPYIRGYNRPAYYGSRYKDVTIDTTHPDYPTDRLSQ